MLFGRKKRAINHILIVEDEPLVAFDNEHFLRESGYEIAGTVDHADEAIAAIGRDTIDLVLADVNLSDGGNGIDVARAAHARGIAVLFVSGNCPGEAKKLAAGCLSKPYLQRNLRAAIEAIDLSLKGGTPRKLPPGFTLFADETV